MKYPVPLIALALGLAGALGSAPATQAAEPEALGLWLNAAQGWVVETVACESGLCGYLVSFLKGNSVIVARDSQNPDTTKRGTPLCGLMLLGNFKPSKKIDEKWENGWVYDPETGSTYTGDAEMTDANTVSLRGYVLIPLFGRTLTLTRETGTLKRCSVPADDAKAASAINAMPVQKVAAFQTTETRRH